MIACKSNISANLALTSSVALAELLENPVYDTLVKIHGEVSLLDELLCPCFELTSDGQLQPQSLLVL